MSITDNCIQALQPNVPWEQVGSKAARGAQVGGIIGLVIGMALSLDQRGVPVKIVTIATAIFQLATVTALLFGTYAAFGTIPTIVGAIVILGNLGSGGGFIGSTLKAGLFVAIVRVAQVLLSK